MKMLNKTKYQVVTDCHLIVHGYKTAIYSLACAVDLFRMRIHFNIPPYGKYTHQWSVIHFRDSIPLNVFPLAPTVYTRDGVLLVPKAVIAPIARTIFFFNPKGAAIVAHLLLLLLVLPPVYRVSY